MERGRECAIWQLGSGPLFSLRARAHAPGAVGPWALYPKYSPIEAVIRLYPFFGAALRRETQMGVQAAGWLAGLPPELG